MWIRKTDAEIAQEITKERSSLKSKYGKPAFHAFILAFGFAVMQALGLRGGLRFAVWFEPRGPFLQELQSELPRAGVIFLVLFGALWIYYSSGSRSFFSDEATMCNRCNDASTDPQGTVCKCGGLFEPLTYWKWQDETEPDSNNS